MDRCMKSLQELDEAGIISLLEDDFGVSPKPGSHIMSQHMVDFHVAVTRAMAHTPRAACAVEGAVLRDERTRCCFDRLPCWYRLS